jgi:uncharacterized membrane protein
MELSPEEKRRVYEEEKARIEAEDNASLKSGRPGAETSTGLDPNVGALLCYLGWWITGLIFFILEQKDLRVRFHAAQSLVFFAAVVIVSIIVRWIPFVGGIFSAIIIIIGFIFWIVLMVKAYHGEHYMLPVVGEIAERMAVPPGQAPPYRVTPPPPAPNATVTAPPPPAVSETPPAQPKEPDRHEARATERDARRYRRERQEARIAGGSVAIAFLIAILVFFNVPQFREIIGYSTLQANGLVTHSIFTSDISRWLAYLDAAVAIGIIGQLFLMFVDNTFLRRSARLVMDALGFVAVVALLMIYPFDFSVIPNSDAAFWAPIVITAILIFIAVVLGIILIVRIIQLLVQAVRVLLGSEGLD